jgi:hypothetical protein
VKYEIEECGGMELKGYIEGFVDSVCRSERGAVH